MPAELRRMGEDDATTGKPRRTFARDHEQTDYDMAYDDTVKSMTRECGYCGRSYVHRAGTKPICNSCARDEGF